MNPLITIVTAAYRLEGLKKAIESINNQTYTNWNHIIVNDGQEDIRKNLDNLCKDNRRMWVDLGFRSHYYGGLCRNIGAILSFCYLHEKKRDTKNEWVLFLDDDNLWTIDHLQSIVDVINSNNNASIVATDALWVGQKDKKWEKIVPIMLRHGKCDLGQFAYKTWLFKEYGYFDPCPEHKHRWDWELIKKITIGEEDRLYYTNKPTFIMNYKKR